jgi:hypothetical protein
MIEVRLDLGSDIVSEELPSHPLVRCSRRDTPSLGVVGSRTLMTGLGALLTIMSHVRTVIIALGAQSAGRRRDPLEHAVSTVGISTRSGKRAARRHPLCCVSFAALQIVQVFEEQSPRRLLGIVEFRRATRLLPKHIVDILEGLLEH